MATTAEWHPQRGGRPTRSRYSTVAMVLHWLIALAIFYNLVSGLLRPQLPPGFFVFHVSSGITILTPTIVRIVWRLTHKPPALLPMAGWERWLAHGVHALLYVAMVVLPVTGWMIVSANPPVGSPGAAASRAEQVAKAQAAGKPAPEARGRIYVWSVVPLPMIGPINEVGGAPEGLGKQRAMHDNYAQLHFRLGWILLALLALHVGGALKHQFVDRMPELQRMGLGRRRD